MPIKNLRFSHLYFTKNHHFGSLWKRCIIREERSIREWVGTSVPLWMPGRIGSVNSKAYSPTKEAGIIGMLSVKAILMLSIIDDFRMVVACAVPQV
jgi:hypothetical protein